MRTISIAPPSLIETPSSSPADSSFIAQRSPWRSPVPYLFGGLAAMLGFIAFALLILACSYWKISARLEDRAGRGRDLENGQDEKESDSLGKGQVKVYEENFLVIMAGEETPSFLATPVTAKIVSFDRKIGEDVKKKGTDDQNSDEDREKITQKEMSNHDQVSNPEQNITVTDILSTQVQVQRL